MSNVRSFNLHGSTFFKTIHSQAYCDKSQIEYLSPKNEALKIKKDNDITIMAQDKQNGFNTYGNISYDKLNNIYRKNHHLYEVMGDNRKLYFDIEYNVSNDSQDLEMRAKINEFLIDLCNDLKIKYNQNKFIITGAFGKGEKGQFKNKEKYSFHFILNDKYMLKGLDDIKKFKLYLKFKLNQEKYKGLKTDDSYAIDTLPYGKDGLFKLPFQSKQGSTRIHYPYNKFFILSDFLVSYNVNEQNGYIPIDLSNVNIEMIEKENKQKQELIKKHNIKITTDNNAVCSYLKLLEYVEDYKTQPQGKPTTDIHYLVKSIYNGKEINRYIYNVMAGAIKRATNNEGFNLFDEWTKGYQPYDKNLNIQTFNNASNKFHGYPTLLNMALVCNPLFKEWYNDRAKELFNIDNIDKLNPNKDIINQRYLDYDLQKFNNHNTIFIKSPMGTGKSYNINKLLNSDKKNYKNVIYLSCKRAFASSMSNDFKQHGFVNYMDKENFKGDENKIIISLESLYKYQYDSCDLLIIDESETIFSNISGEPLRKNNVLQNINKLYELISQSEKVLIMDAYLTNRSIDLINIIRPQAINNSYYIQNDFKYQQRKAILFKGKKEKSLFINTLLKKLKEGKRVALVTGSKSFTDKHLIPILDNESINYKYYNKNNKLNNEVNINQEWSNTQCLIYTPTITAGISYTNEQFKYDNLFIYTVNKGSCVVRDTIQAHKRIRHFNDDKIYICINDDFKAFNYTHYSTDEKIIFDNLNNNRYHLFDESIRDNIASIEIGQNNFSTWLINCMVFNIKERNISDLYQKEVMLKYLQHENIIEFKPVEEKFELKLKQNTNIDTSNIWDFEQIDKLDKQQYKQIIYKLSKGENITLDEIKQINKYIFIQRFNINNNEDKLKESFNEWYNINNGYEYINNIKTFKKLIHIGIDNFKKISIEKHNQIEFYKMDNLILEHIHKILSKLKIIQNNKIDLNNTFTTLDFDELTNEYKKLNKHSFNLLLKDRYIKRTNKGKNIDFTNKTMLALINNMLKENFNYEIKSIGTKQKSINGKRKKIQIYKLTTYKDVSNDLLTLFKDDFNEL